MNNPENAEHILEAMRKVNLTHQVIHIHGQNQGYYVNTNGKTFCSQIEVTYVKLGKYNLLQNYDVELPVRNVDAPSDPDIPEIKLGRWNQKIVPDDKSMSVTIIKQFTPH